MDLNGGTAVVTGGNGGLGQRICRALAREGANIAVVYNVSEEQARGVASELRDSGVQAEAFQCDVRSPEQVDALVPAVLETFGRLDILVNDAAYNIWIPFSDMDALTFEEWTKILDTNLTGPMLCTKAVAGPMRRGGAGRIVNISSIAGLGPQGSSIPYAVSKAGLIHLTRCTALGLAPEILVNCVAPGYIEGTRATANLAPAYRKKAQESSALKIPADKDDIADQVVTLCRSDTTTGQTIVVDSGRFYH